MARPIQVTIDCADPGKLAEFWATALDYQLPDPPDGFKTWPDFLKEQGVPESEFNSAAAVEDPDGDGPRVFFQRVPEKKKVKNRVHIDINAGGGKDVSDKVRKTNVDKVVKKLVKAGATMVDEREMRGERWVVMEDPEGNEFCVQ